MLVKFIYFLSKYTGSHIFLNISNLVQFLVFKPLLRTNCFKSYLIQVKNRAEQIS